MFTPRKKKVILIFNKIFIILIEYSEDIQILIEHSLNSQQKIKLVIDQNSEFVKSNQTSPIYLEQEKRIMSNLNAAVIKSFQEAVTENQIVQNEIKNIKQNKTIRNAEIVLGRKLNPKESESVINNPAVKIEIYNKTIL